MEIEQSKIQLKIKWVKKIMNVDLSKDEKLESLKATLYSMTDVLPVNQKLLCKGKYLKGDEKRLEELELKNDSLIVLIGKPEDKTIDLQKIQDEKEKNVFIEDLTPQEKAKYMKKIFDTTLPLGLNNLGNTCYMNSCIQVLFKIRELKEFILQNNYKNSNDLETALVKGITKLFIDLDNKGESFSPNYFLDIAFSIFPQFAQKAEHGQGFQQQDIDEFFQLLINTIAPKLALPNSEKNLIQDIFQFQLKVDFVNSEDETEKSESRYEVMNKLACIIDNQMNPVNNLEEGIKAGLEEEVEKYSENLQRNCLWKKTSKVISLPKYLIVQKIRFVWRERDEGTNAEAGKAKILRNVSFPKILDLFEFCDENFKQTLLKNRQTQVETEDKQKEDKKNEFENYKKKNNAEIDSYKLYKQFQEEQKLIEEKEHDEKLWKELNEESKETGNYELIGVITHKGRSSDSGHYVAWIHQKGDHWLKFDDDLVTKQSIEDILNLRGGGDWHMAYYLIYRKLQL
jgi:ubiquitin carboxyl-terminal hydrolase 14